MAHVRKKIALSPACCSGILLGLNQLLFLFVLLGDILGHAKQRIDLAILIKQRHLVDLEKPLLSFLRNHATKIIHTDSLCFNDHPIMLRAFFGDTFCHETSVGLSDQILSCCAEVFRSNMVTAQIPAI